MYIYDQNDVCHLSGCFKVICFKYIKPGLEVPKRKKKICAIPLQSNYI